MYNLEELKPHVEVWSQCIENHAKKILDPQEIEDGVLIKQECGWPLVCGQKGSYR